MKTKLEEKLWISALEYKRLNQVLKNQIKLTKSQTNEKLVTHKST